MAALAAEMDSENVVPLRDEDDERTRFRRWIAIGRRIDAGGDPVSGHGAGVSDDERAWHADYGASSECRSLVALAEDFPQLMEA